jgi:hypothetical protein
MKQANKIDDVIRGRNFIKTMPDGTVLSKPAVTNFDAQRLTAQ